MEEDRAILRNQQWGLPRRSVSLAMASVSLLWGQLGNKTAVCRIGRAWFKHLSFLPESSGLLFSPDFCVSPGNAFLLMGDMWEYLGSGYFWRCARIGDYHNFVLPLSILGFGERKWVWQGGPKEYSELQGAAS